MAPQDAYCGAYEQSKVSTLFAPHLCGVDNGCIWGGDTQIQLLYR